MHEEEDDFVVAGTENGDENKRSLSGLPKGHSYLVLGTFKLSDGKRLVKIRNPWGAENFSGAFSGTNIDGKDKDGIFYADIETYTEQFSETWISLDPTKMSSAKFMKLNDESQKTSPGIWEGMCGEECTRHTLTLKSDIAQTVYLTAHTWNDRGIPDRCTDSDNEKFHAIMVNKLDNIFVWHFGDYPLQPIKMTSGDGGALLPVDGDIHGRSQSSISELCCLAVDDGSPDGQC